MQELIDHLGRCSTKASTAKSDDLTALVELHMDLMATHSLAANDKNAKPDIQANVLSSVDHIAQIVEKLVLNESDGAEISIQAVNRQIGDLQKLISGVTTVPPGKAATPAAPVPPAAAKPIAEAPVAKPATVVTREEKVITEADAPLALEFVGEANGHLEAAEASLLKLEDDATDINELNAVFRAFHTIKGVAGFLGLKQIGALAHSAETLLDLARKGKLQCAGGVLDVVLESRDALVKMVQSVDTAARSSGTPTQHEGLDQLLQRLEAATRGETVAAGAKPEPAPAAAAVQAAVATPVAVAKVETATAPVAAVAAEPDAAKSSGAVNTTNNNADGVVKVSTSRLDSLVNAVGELVIAQAMVTQDLAGASSTDNQRLIRNLSHLGKITRGLQELSMAMRMVPIAGVFQKMARLCRDTARKAGKEVEFVQVGSETELDRNVVDAISDPLVHMVRNSVDHGVEYPEDRVKAGKPRVGKVLLKAFHQSGNIVIEITDDGRGLNTQRIVQKAIAAGIVKEGQELTEQQTFQLIFHPGLSTAEKITDISGRGVGMDVVRKNVEALRGRIEIASTPGKGSTFTVRLPLTLAVIDGLIVRVGAHRYIIPITSIEQSIRPTADQLSSVQGRGELCMVRERLLPIVRLHELFHVEPKTTDPTKALVVIVQEGSDRCCILVDELIGQQQVVIKSVGKEIGHLPGIAGCAILGDGNVSLILDIAGTMQTALKQKESQ